MTHLILSPTWSRVVWLCGCYVRCFRVFILLGCTELSEHPQIQLVSFNSAGHLMMARIRFLQTHGSHVLLGLLY